MKTESTKTYARRALEAKVRLVNRVHEDWNRLAVECETAFEPLIGKKVLKSDNSWTALAKKACPEVSRESYPSSGGLGYDISIIVKSSENVDGEHHCIYYERPFYIGAVENGLLKTVYSADALRTDYSADEIEELRRIAEQKAKEARNAESALCPFGLSTR